MKEIMTTFLFKHYIFELQGTGKNWSYQNCIIKPTGSIIKSFLGDQITDYNHGIWFGIGIFHTYTLLRNTDSKDLKNLYLKARCKWQNVGCIRFFPQLLSQRKFKLTYKYSLASKKTLWFFMGYCYSLLMEYTLYMYFKILYGVWYVTLLLWNRRKENNVPNHKGFQPELYEMKKAEQANTIV